MTSQKPGFAFLIFSGDIIFYIGHTTLETKEKAFFFASGKLLENWSKLLIDHLWLEQRSPKKSVVFLFVLNILVLLFR